MGIGFSSSWQEPSWWISDAEVQLRELQTTIKLEERLERIAREGFTPEEVNAWKVAKDFPRTHRKEKE